MSRKKLRFTHDTHCHQCGKEHYSNRNKLVLSLKDFKTYCSDNDACKQFKEHLVPLDNPTILNKIYETYPGDFAAELEGFLQRTFSVRPSIPVIYYLMQLSEQLKIGSWNGVLMHVLKEYMKDNPINKPIKESPFFNFQHSSFNDLVDNPFAVAGSVEIDVKTEPVEPLPKPEPEPQPEPEPEKEEPEEDIFTI